MASKNGRAGGETSQDPDELVRQIERTREELAGTVEQIADRVNPKRVVERGKQRATEVAHNVVTNAKIMVSQAVGTARDRALAARESAAQAALTAKENAAHAAASAKDTATTAVHTATESATSAVHNAKESATSAVHSATESASSAVHSAKESATSAVHGSTESGTASTGGSARVGGSQGGGAGAPALLGRVNEIAEPYVTRFLALPREQQLGAAGAAFLLLVWLAGRGGHSEPPPQKALHSVQRSARKTGRKAARRAARR